MKLVLSTIGAIALLLVALDRLPRPTGRASRSDEFCPDPIADCVFFTLQARRSRTSILRSPSLRG